ncbi:IS5 family transposase [Spiroplasma ixodetis]
MRSIQIKTRTPTTFDLFQTCYICKTLFFSLKSIIELIQFHCFLHKYMWEKFDYYFQIWSKNNDKEPSVLQLILKKLVKKIRIKNHRKEKTSFCIIDSQSVKNTDTTENKGYDAGKKISGIKRHIAVDTQGLPHAIYITTAEKTDRNSAIIMIKSEKENLSTVQKIIVDAGYTGEKFASAIKTIINANVEVVKRNELHSFVVLPKRWVVERSFAWLEKCRRLWKNCERKLNTSLQMVVLSFISILLKDSKQVLRTCLESFRK